MTEEASRKESPRTSYKESRKESPGASHGTRNSSPDLSMDLCSIGLKNPVILASGILASTPAGIRRAAAAGFGAVVTKTLTLKPREGYPGPSAVELDRGMVLNAMGLPNPGIEKFIADMEGVELECPLIVSISGDTPDEFAAAALGVAPVAAAVELNISCPHPKPHGGRKILIGQDVESAAETVAAVKDALRSAGRDEEKGPVPVIAKLPPMVVLIGEIAVACAKAGADAIAAINTVPALEIVPEIERPVLGNMIGGQSGTSIRPIALRRVAEISVALCRARENGEIEHDVPVIGIGGISSGTDAVKFILAGASCVQAGSHFIDDLDVERILEELRIFMEGKGYGCLDDFRGNALDWLMNVLG